MKRFEDRKHLKDELLGRKVNQNPEGKGVRAINPEPSGRPRLAMGYN